MKTNKQMEEIWMKCKIIQLTKMHETTLKTILNFKQEIKIIPI